MAGIITDLNKLGGVPQSASRHVAMSTCYDIYLNGDTHIGFVSQITVGHSRTVTQIRHLNSVDAGIAVDSVVTPDAVNLNFNGFYVYSQGSGQTLGDVKATAKLQVGATIGRVAGVDLLMTLDQQQTPFDLVLRHNVTNTAAASAIAGTIVGAYKNCTIQTMSVPINIGSAAIADSGVIVVGYVGRM